MVANSLINLATVSSSRRRPVFMRDWWSSINSCRSVHIDADGPFSEALRHTARHKEDRKKRGQVAPLHTLTCAAGLYGSKSFDGHSEQVFIGMAACTVTLTQGEGKPRASARIRSHFCAATWHFPRRSIMPMYSKS